MVMAVVPPSEAPVTVTSVPAVPGMLVGEVDDTTGVDPRLTSRQVAVAVRFDEGMNTAVWTAR
jgi:hypothetical protein